MAEEYINMAEHLKSLLDVLEPENKFNVSNERNLDGVFNNNIVVSALSGTTTKNSATIPYQFDIITNNPQYIMDLFTKLAKDYNRTTFRVIKGDKIYDIWQTYNTPVVMEKDIENGSNHSARIVVFATLYIMFNVSNIKTLTIDNEEIDQLEGSITYVAEPNANKLSGIDMMKHKVKTSTTQIAFSMIVRNSVFSRKAFLIETGQMDGNTPFNVHIEKTNGQIADLVMMISSIADAWADNSLPSLKIAMLPYDDRE